MYQAIRKKVLVTAIIILSAVFFPASVSAQATFEVRMGKGYFAKVSIPSGWTKGTGFGSELCWNAPGNAARICVKSNWKRGRTAETILSESLEGISCVRQDNKTHKTDILYTVWKECEVKVGPRTEWRLWSVTTYKDAPDALSIEVHFYQRPSEQLKKEIDNCLNGISFVDPLPASE